jgi:tetratricopeptide (TPR) repeat protein
MRHSSNTTLLLRATSSWAAPVLLACTALGSQPSLAVSNNCKQMISAVSDQIASGDLDNTKPSVTDSLNGDLGRAEPVCAGLLANTLAAGLQIAGRLDEARMFAEQAIEYFQRTLPEGAPAYLPPLHILATIDLLQGMTGRAREVYRRMQAIRTTSPGDRALLLWINASLLEHEGRRQEAESALRDVSSILSDAGRRNSADAASTQGQLACLYLGEHRYQDAATALDSALTTLSLAPDAAPLDRIKLLNTRATVWAHENRWKDAESDLAEAVSLARQQPKLDSPELWLLLKNYACVLRKLHRKEAQSVETWAASLRAGNAKSRQVIDMAELAAGSSNKR